MKKIGTVAVALLVVTFVAANSHGQEMPSPPEPPEEPPETGGNETMETEQQQERTQQARTRRGQSNGAAQQNGSGEARIQGNQRQGPPENVGPARAQQRLEEIEQKLAEKNVTAPGIDQAQESVAKAQKIHSTVSALKQAGNLTSIGPQVSQIAQDINRSSTEAVEAEEELGRRGGISRALFGMNHRAADSLEENANETLQRVRSLQDRLDECENCSEAVKGFMQERIETLQNESQGWQQRAEQAKRSKGVLGWLWK